MKRLLTFPLYKPRDIEPAVKVTQLDFSKRMEDADHYLKYATIDYILKRNDNELKVFLDLHHSRKADYK